MVRDRSVHGRTIKRRIFNAAFRLLDNGIIIIDGVLLAVSGLLFNTRIVQLYLHTITVQYCTLSADYPVCFGHLCRTEQLERCRTVF